MTPDVLIIGGGVVGLTSAIALAQKGARVQVVEARRCGDGASGSSAALLECQVDAWRHPLFSRLCAESNALFPALQQTAMALAGTGFELEQNGIVNLALNDEEARALQHEVEGQRGQKRRAEWLDPETVRSDWPAIDPEQCGAALFFEDGQVNGERFLAAMRNSAVALGAHILEEAGEGSFETQGGRVTGWVAQAGRFTADRYVVAAGAWSDLALASLGVRLGITPIRGQLVVFDTPKRPVACPIYTKHNGYIAPKEDGYTIAGATVEDVGFDAFTTPEAVSALTVRARRILPALSRATVRGATAGLRPGSPDSFPVIGPLPTHPEVLVATGHYRNGILLAPVTADLVTRFLFNEPVDEELVSFLSPGRFLS